MGSQNTNCPSGVRTVRGVTKSRVRIVARAVKRFFCSKSDDFLLPVVSLLHPSLSLSNYGAAVEQRFRSFQSEIIHA